MGEHLESKKEWLYPIVVGHSARGTIYLHPDGSVVDVVDDEGSFTDEVNAPSEEGAKLYEMIEQRRSENVQSDENAGADAAFELYAAMFAGHEKQAALELYRRLFDER